MRLLTIMLLSFSIPFMALADERGRAGDAPGDGAATAEAATDRAEALKAEHGLTEEEAREVADAFRRGSGDAEDNHGAQVSALVLDALEEGCRGECLADRLRAFNDPEARGLADRDGPAQRARGDAEAAAARERGAATSGAAREGAIGRDAMPDAAGRAAGGRGGR
jgi:hypothetical protein